VENNLDEVWPQPRQIVLQADKSPCSGPIGGTQDPKLVGVVLVADIGLQEAARKQAAPSRPNQRGATRKPPVPREKHAVSRRCQVAAMAISPGVVVGIGCVAYDLRTFTARGTPRATKEPDSMIEQQPTVLSLSDAAALKLRELTKEETNPNIGLRVYVYSGGCSGFRYGMMLEDAPTPEDNLLDVNGVKVYVDGQSIPLLQGAEIDYVDTLMGAGFTVNNPNAVAACGCGSSFRTADDAGTARSCAH
jgi:iron-sulfur cluster assembly accessory protein